jgi:Raf kinase inhibitor-like YbhB/YbcL family protein
VISRILIAAAITLTLGFAQNGTGKKGRIPGMRITIPAFPNGGAIPAKYGCAATSNANRSPAIQWSGAPDGTMSFVLILRDADTPRDFLHWAIFNIPATADGLPEQVPAKTILDDGSAQLKNDDGSIGYFNPCPPATHRYEFQLYALDTKLDPAPKNRDALMTAMKGHIVAEGTYSGSFRQ